MKSLAIPPLFSVYVRATPVAEARAQAGIPTKSFEKEKRYPFEELPQVPVVLSLPRRPGYKRITRFPARAKPRVETPRFRRRASPRGIQGPELK